MSRESPLVDAARDGELSQLVVLVRDLEEASPAPIDPYTLWHPLLAAIESNHAGVAQFLLSHGAEANAECMRRALQHDAPNEMLQILIDHGIDVNCTSSAGLPILDTALGHEPQLRFLLERGADPNQMWGRWRKRPLDYCASFHGVKELQILLEHGAILDKANPLHAAAAANTDKDRIPVMEYLIDECKIDVNAISNFGPRMHTQFGDEDGTALQQAVRSGHKDRIAYLLSRGADPKVKSVRGNDAFEFARKMRSADRIQILEEVLADQKRALG